MPEIHDGPDVQNSSDRAQTSAPPPSFAEGFSLIVRPPSVNSESSRPPLPSAPAATARPSLVSTSPVATNEERLSSTLGRSHDVPHWLNTSITVVEAKDLPRQGLTASSSSIPVTPGHLRDQRAAATTAPASTRTSVIHFPGSSASGSLTANTISAAAAGARIRTAEPLVPFPAQGKRQSIALFSLAGGTGCSSIAAGLTRVLSASGERVLLADSCAHSLLPRHFGGGEGRPGTLRRFIPSIGRKDQAISILSIAADAFAGDDIEQHRILRELTRSTARVQRVIWDLSGAPLDWASKVLGATPQILVPILPTASCLAQLPAVERFLNRCRRHGTALQWRYVVNRFDARDRAHIETRARFEQQLGERLLPLNLRCTPLIDEALSRSRSVVDHAPTSPFVEDTWQLARHLEQFTGPAEWDPSGLHSTCWFEEKN